MDLIKVGAAKKSSRKSSCVNARGIPPAAYQAHAILFRKGVPPAWEGRYPPAKVGTPPPPVEVWTDTQTETITFPHPSDAGGKNGYIIDGNRCYLHFTCTHYWSRFPLVLTARLTFPLPAFPSHRPWASQSGQSASVMWRRQKCLIN